MFMKLYFRLYYFAKMDNSICESLNWCLDQEKEPLSSQVQEGYGKAPRLGKKGGVPSMPAVNNNGVNLGADTFSSSQQSFENASSAESNELSKSTQMVKKSAFESKEPVCFKPGGIPSKPAVNEGGVNFGANIFSSSQQCFENASSAECNELVKSTQLVKQSAIESKEPVCVKPRSQESQELRRSSQLDDIPEFDAKDKMFWFCEFKRVYMTNKKLTKRIERTNSKIARISVHVDKLSEILK